MAERRTMDIMPTTRSVTIQSLSELEVHLSAEVRKHLAEPYKALCSGVDNTEEDPSLLANQHLEQVLCAMKTPPRTSYCRVNRILANKDQVIKSLEQELQEWIVSCGAQDQLHVSVSPHKILEDVVAIDITSATTRETETLVDSKIPTVDNQQPVLFAKWPSRQKLGWPMTHRVVLCDRFCGEAVLRGSSIFVRGVVCADSGIASGETVAVYADIRDDTAPCLSRGLLLEQYSGTCVFLGIGTAACKRADMFNSSQGLGIQMSPLPWNRAGPILPPLHGMLATTAVFQNLPSVVVGHALQPAPGNVILDMCAAPGGKTSHLASVVHNQATIVACDKSRKKMVSARAWFERLGATCITPLALDSTDCVQPSLHSLAKDHTPWKSVPEVLALAQLRKKDGLLDVTRFYPESFDRILLDPPCSALGLRPKLFVTQTTLDDLKYFASNQRCFARQAVALLKPGGIMTYSTCTIHGFENEAMVRHVLDEYPIMELLPIDINLGLPGLGGFGLDERECSFVRRFDPADKKADTMGFFIAKFQKKI